MVIERRTSYRSVDERKILFVNPFYGPSFGTFYHSYQFFRNIRGLMTPLGILTVANYLPTQWTVRILDENVRVLSDEDIDWADVVFVSGMHIHRPWIQRINDRAHGRGKMTVLGGCSVSAAPEDYPEFDVIHCGELGDATDQLIEFVDRTPVGFRPEKQHRFTTIEKIPLDEFPCPAYHLVDLNSYLLTTVQFSSGCPFSCEFCDIPALYGHNPRLKPVEKILHELDIIKQTGFNSAIYFVDDNFIGNQKAVKEFLPELARWQKENNYPFNIGIEATINLALRTDLLELMREAYITDCYFGIESPEEDTLKDISKKQNIRMPIVDALDRVRTYGIEAVTGLILGFDRDTEETEQFMLKFIEESNCPIIAINLLFALPKTPLWDRLEKEGRLLPYEEAQHTNIRFKMPNEKVVAMWRNCIHAAYEPNAVYRRYQHNVETTYNARLPLELSRHGRSWDKLPPLAYTLAKIFWVIGLRSNYRRTFWKQMTKTLRHSDLESAITIAVMGYHLIEYGRRDCKSDTIHASYFTKG